MSAEATANTAAKTAVDAGDAVSVFGSDDMTGFSRRCSQHSI